MKLKCNDGVVRRFRISRFSLNFSEWIEAKCAHCGWEFGVNDTWVLKPKFKAHICHNPKKEE